MLEFLSGLGFRASHFGVGFRAQGWEVVMLRMAVVVYIRKLMGLPPPTAISKSGSTNDGFGSLKTCPRPMQPTLSISCAKGLLSPHACANKGARARSSPVTSHVANVGQNPVERCRFCRV